VRSYSDKIFRGLTTAVLLLFCVGVVLIFVADAAYVNMASIRELWESEYVRNALSLSFVSSIIATLLSLVVGVPAAYALSRGKFRGILLLDIIVDLLIVMPVLVIGISLLVVFRVGGDLAESGVLVVRWLGQMIAATGDFFVYTRAGVVLAQFFCAVSFVIRTIKTTFDEVDQRTEQVALTLGCSRWGAFWRITLPLARRGILAGGVLGWLRAFGVFGAVIIVGGAVRNRTEVLPTAIYLEISIGRLESAIAISLLMVAAAALMLVLLRVLFGATLFGTGRK
jgi:molybdate transport system permease protein